MTLQHQSMGALFTLLLLCLQLSAYGQQIPCPIKAGDTFTNDGNAFNNLNCGVYGTLNNQLTGTFSNYNTLAIEEYNSGSGTVMNSGIMINYGIVSNRGALLNSGILINAVGGTISGVDGFLINDGVIDNFGSMTTPIDLGGFESSGVINNYGDLIANDNSLITSGILNNHGYLESASSDISNTGVLSNYRGAIIDIFDSLSSVGTLNNDGVININIGGLGSSGILNNTGTIQGPGSLVSDGKINNSGQVLVGDILIRSGGSYTQTAGSTVVNGRLTSAGAPIAILGGTLSGFGIINGDVEMGGTFVAGNVGINGIYSQTHSGIFSTFLAGTNCGQGDCGQLVVNGSVFLDGTLDVVLSFGFMPKLGDSFALVLYDFELGRFSNFDLPSLPKGESWITTYGPNEFTLTVEPTTPEPSTLLLFATAILGVFSTRRWNSSARRVTRPSTRKTGAPF